MNAVNLRREGGEVLVFGPRVRHTLTRREAVAMNEAHRRSAIAVARRHRRENSSASFAALGTDHALVVAACAAHDEVARLGEVSKCDKVAAKWLARRGLAREAAVAQADAVANFEAMKREAIACVALFTRAKAALALLRARLGRALEALRNLPRYAPSLFDLVPTIAGPALASCHAQLAPPCGALTQLATMRPQFPNRL